MSDRKFTKFSHCASFPFIIWTFSQNEIWNDDDFLLGSFSQQKIREIVILLSKQATLGPIKMNDVLKRELECNLICMNVLRLQNKTSTMKKSRCSYAIK